MTDAEVLATFMEPKPELPPSYSHLALSPKHWWVLGPINGGGMKWFPAFMGSPIGLEGCHLIEARLTDEQWDRYYHAFGRRSNPDPICWYAPDRVYKWALHATAEQKIKALASVLRQEVQG